MQPTIITLDKLFIAGLTGDGNKTGEVWGEAENLYDKKPFKKSDDNGYEIRFFDGEKPATPGKDIHVGFLNEIALDNGNLSTIALPAGEYAVFEVFVAKGYDSGNAEMDKWLEDNSAQYGQSAIDGVHYVVECYKDEKFKGGDKPDSIVEIWIPLYRFCQSCYMAMPTIDKRGTEANGNPNQDYCCYCYKNGDFATKQTLEEAVEGNIQFWRDGCKNDDEARARIMAVFPKLKRWAK